MQIIDNLCNACDVLFSAGFTPKDDRNYCPDCQQEADLANAAMEAAK